MIVHAVPGTICRHYVAVVMARAGTVSLVHEDSIQPISVVISSWGLSRVSATAAHIGLYVQHLWEHDVTSYLASHHAIPAQVSTTKNLQVLPMHAHTHTERWSDNSKNIMPPTQPQDGWQHKKPSIEDEGQTNHVTILANPKPLIFNSQQTMVIGHDTYTSRKSS